MPLTTFAERHPFTTQIHDMNTAQTVAQKLLEIEAVMLNVAQPFTWTSGIKSPIYCDNRRVLSYPEARNLVKESLATVAQAAFAEFDMVAGVATAGVPHGALVADILGLPYIYVRDKSKGHGLRNLIEGHVKGGERVLVVEDLISTGGSSIKAVEAIRERGCEVVGVVAIFDYGFDKSRDAFAAADCPYATLSNYHVLIEEAVAMNYVQASDVATLQEWRKAPEAWQPVG